MTAAAHEIHQALEENRSARNGTVRNARAEELVALAETTGDRPLLLDALFDLVSAYEYSSERAKMFVPFSRLLRMWDEHPEDFGERAVYQLHWRFKWVSTGMIGYSDIPLESIRRWLVEMGRRYALGGYSQRPVRAAEYSLARHTGDMAAAADSLAAWTAADRDIMSDCRACELNDEGEWHADLGEDERAVAAWAPVLAGEHSCQEEPHRVLALSLLPLVRLGRTDEARGNHLRGYRLARGNESLLPSIGRHIEFCALTGNEARGLEILAEHTAHLEGDGTPLSRLHFLGAAAVLLRRLTALGHGDRPVPAPGATTRTAAELLIRTEATITRLARGFDERNGTDTVSTWVTERLGSTPLLDRLPLGVRAARLPETAPAAAADMPSADAAAERSDDLTELIARARELSRAQRDAAYRAWAAVGRAADRTGTPLDPMVRAEVADHAGMDSLDDPPAALALLTAAVADFEAAGEYGEAAACRGRAAYAMALAGPAQPALAAADAACEQLRELHAKERATTRQFTGALLLRARIRLGTIGQAADPQAAAAAVEAKVSDILVLAEAHRDEDRVLGRIADATCLLGRLVAGRGDVRGAAEAFTRASALHQESGRPWLAVEGEAMLAELALNHGDPHTAARAARSALDLGAGILTPAHHAHLLTVLAQALADTGQDDEAADHALEGAHRADEAGDGEDTGGWARLVLGGALNRLGRAAEAAAVLETALPDLRAAHHEGRVVQARWWLGECLLQLAEPREAAEQFLLAAEIAKEWEEQQDHANLAHLAADALNRAGLDDQAVQAYERAEQLWRALGRTPAVVRALRARAWIELREGRPGLPAARRAMESAAQAAAAALAAATDEDERDMLRADLADTHLQTGQLLVRGCPGEPGDADTDGSARAAYEEALVHTGRAAATYGSRDGRSAAQLVAAWIEADLGRRDAAADRARAVLADYGDEEGETAERRRAEAGSVLDHTKQPPDADPAP
ncbi:tetratricopeptide repeat protein [Streptomyces sp. RKAG293]|uniref:tetratricopeptide repeat protein n=1 Tax=Streptomyces sp. RKAG293 TaxID=2893403 RepID=UPI0020343316|nr:tetratricopeptide repeat protein [Streptomyces sp. RKAG293]MCM2417615.1 tetratricopeptide repeat protein [Streptomyces sp. RKAG293]